MNTPLVIVWRVYEPCNLSCDFCGHSAALVRPRAVFDVARAERFGAVLADFRRATGREVFVSWLGGEPLLWGELPGLSRRFHREFGLAVGTTTNGTPLDDDAVRESLVADYARLTVSVDGPADFHDACRRSPGLFARLRRNVRAVRAAADAAGSRLILQVNTILMRGNVDQFAALCDEVVEWGVRELTFNQLGGADRPEFYPANRLLLEQVARFAHELPDLRERLARRGLTIAGSDRYLERLASTAAGRRIPIDDCEPGAWFLFVDETGRVAPCSFTPGVYGVPLEQIDHWSRLADLPRRFARDRRERRAAACDDCHCTQVFDKYAAYAPSGMSGSTTCVRSESDSCQPR